nr:MAG TPA: hypothetical protein [Caudoviricetes sp.]
MTRVFNNLLYMNYLGLETKYIKIAPLTVLIYLLYILYI